MGGRGRRPVNTRVAVLLACNLPGAYHPPDFTVRRRSWEFERTADPASASGVELSLNVRLSLPVRLPRQLLAIVREDAKWRLAHAFAGRPYSCRSLRRLDHAFLVHTCADAAWVDRREQDPIRVK